MHTPPLPNTFVLFVLFTTLLASCCSANEILRMLPQAEYPEAQCLDGSQGGYYYRMNNASANFLIYHEGGGWCMDLEGCAQRAFTQLGSSKHWTPVPFQGLFSASSTLNPYFYDWNLVFIRYCDGSSYSSYANPVLHGNVTLHFRGKAIINAVKDDIYKLFPNINNAKTIIVTGSSAGGLATYMHVDWWRNNLPQSANVVGMADAGWFQYAPNIHGVYQHSMRMRDGFYLFNSSGFTNEDCIAHYPAHDQQWHCFFTPFIFPFIKTPMFVLQSRFDSNQVMNILQLGCNPQVNCNASQLARMDQYGVAQYQSMQAAFKSEKDGVFSDSCYFHTQSIFDETWNGVKVNGMTIMNTFIKWLENGKIQNVDNCNFGCNKTCPPNKKAEQ